MAGHLAENCSRPPGPHWRDIMTIFHRAPAGLVASGVFILGLFCASGVATHAAPVNNPVMLINLKTGKCLTIAGGVSTDNNVDTVQFDCDSHPSRSWMLSEMTLAAVVTVLPSESTASTLIAGWMGCPDETGDG